MNIENTCGCMICKNNNNIDMPEEIIEAALRNELVLFCGAGISTESKSVLPFSFYTSILEELESKQGRKIDNKISFSELMSLYVEEFPNGRKKLLKKIKERFDYINSFPQLFNNSTMFHREVASNPYLQTIVTTNWDTYFEELCGCAPIINDTDATLWNVFEKRVFKIHGSINNIGSIVATKEDYEKSYQKLSSDLIGDRLKTILASNTVVFIGFSFGDEDLNKLIDILSIKMGDFYNQYYLITIDKKWNASKNKKIIPIITDGTYFIHELNNELINREALLSSKLYDYAEYLLEIFNYEHIAMFDQDTFKEDFKNYPELLLSIAYQDGFIHSLERCVANRKNGEYLVPGRLEVWIKSYYDYYQLRLFEKNYDQAYYNMGYSDGLLSLNLYIDDGKGKFPGLFFYNQEYFESKNDLFEFISKNRDDRLYTYCKRKTKKTGGIIPHYMPWYC